MTDRDETNVDLSVEEWLQLRKNEGTRIDAGTVEAVWKFAYAVDPCDLDPDLPGELRPIGRARFHLRLGNDIWIYSAELPEQIRQMIAQIRRATLSDDWNDII